MIPIAFGTQTGGSVLRPASYCGVIGFKPSFDSYDLSGVKAAASSFDTLGLIARSLDDIELFHGVLTVQKPGIDRKRESAPRVGICRTHLWEIAEVDTVNAIEDTMTRLLNAGVVLTEIELPKDADRLTKDRAVINAYERAMGLKKEWQEYRNQLSEQMRRTCERGYGIKADEYRIAVQLTKDYRAQIPKVFADIDILLTPTVNGEAPAGHDYAGDPRFQEIWTMLHLPSITLPTHKGRTGLPIGIQLVAAHGQDLKLFAVARWIMDTLFS